MVSVVRCGAVRSLPNLEGCGVSWQYESTSSLKESIRRGLSLVVCIRSTSMGGWMREQYVPLWNFLGLPRATSTK